MAGGRYSPSVIVPPRKSSRRHIDGNKNCGSTTAWASPISSRISPAICGSRSMRRARRRRGCGRPTARRSCGPIRSRAQLFGAANAAELARRTSRSGRRAPAAGRAARATARLHRRDAAGAAARFWRATRPAHDLRLHAARFSRRPSRHPDRGNRAGRSQPAADGALAASGRGRRESGRCLCGRRHSCGRQRSRACRCPVLRDLPEAARSEALDKGRAELAIGGGQMVLHRVGSGTDVGIVATDCAARCGRGDAAGSN